METAFELAAAGRHYIHLEPMVVHRTFDHREAPHFEMNIDDLRCLTSLITLNRNPSNHSCFDVDAIPDKAAGWSTIA